MNFSKFNLTPSAKVALSNSQKIAQNFGHLKVIDMHLLISLLQQDNDNVNEALSVNDVSKEGLINALEIVMDGYAEPKRKKRIFGPEIKEIIEEAQNIAEIKGHTYIGVDHLVLTILTKRDEVIELLNTLEINIKKLALSISDYISNGIEEQMVPQPQGGGSGEPMSQDILEILQSCCTNMNEKVRERGTFEIFGRDEEIERAFEILLRKNKSNVMFVGEAGVGKTAVVEGMAEKIIQRQCPDLLLHKEIIYLDMTSAISGTIYRGQMEEKMKNILAFFAQNEHAILFIDEIHTIIGSGNSEGSLDLANIMKPALSRGEISCIGATTEEEYKRFFQRDAALNRRFEQIELCEPSTEDVKTLLMKAKFSYEEYHSVSYSEDVIDTIIDLCDRHLPNRRFPDKAFDILDEAGAKTKKLNVVRPDAAKEIEKKFIINNKLDQEKFEELEDEYKSILEEWGESLEKVNFSVDKEEIYSIFSFKLNTSIENIKEDKEIHIKGKIGF